MAKFAWLTDLHLNSVDNGADTIKFLEGVASSMPDGVFITGDISTAPNLVYHLSVIDRIIQRPIHFVLGNHDYWQGSIDAVRKQMHELSNAAQYVRYLPLTKYVPLSPNTALVGHDGWYDAQHGDWKTSEYVLNDWYHISDFVAVSGGPRSAFSGNINLPAIVTQSRKMAAEAQQHVADGIKAAAKNFKKIIIMTHVPPFVESYMHNGRTGNVAGHPWYTSKMMGDMILSAAAAYKDRSFVVLCGHTHSEWHGNVAHNVQVHVGAAQYGKLQVAGTIEVQ